MFQVIVISKHGRNLSLDVNGVFLNPSSSASSSFDLGSGTLRRLEETVIVSSLRFMISEIVMALEIAFPEAWKETHLAFLYDDCSFVTVALILLFNVMTVLSILSFSFSFSSTMNRVSLANPQSKYFVKTHESVT